MDALLRESRITAGPEGWSQAKGDESKEFWKVCCVLDVLEVVRFIFCVLWATYMIQVIPPMHKIVDVIRGLTEFSGNGFQTWENRLTWIELEKKRRKFENWIWKWTKFMYSRLTYSNNNLMTIILRIINQLTNPCKLF